MKNTIKMLDAIKKYISNFSQESKQYRDGLATMEFLINNMMPFDDVDKLYKKYLNLH